MSQPPKAFLSNVARSPRLSATRIFLALGIAILADGIQFALGPWGWVVVDQVIDLGAMLLISLVVGFHPLFLPTFIAEFIPGIGMLPTWTGCVAVVLMLRWKAQREQFTAPPPRVPPSQSDVIDV